MSILVRKIIKGIIEYIVALLVMTVVLVIAELFIFKDSASLSLEKALIIAAIISTILLVIIKWAMAYIPKAKYLKSGIGKIDSMRGEEFELYLAAYFELKGYDVATTPASNDYGADLICTKGDEKIVVQAKRYEGKVGTAAVQEVVAARDYYEADRCIVVTNSYFTRNAQDLAEANDVQLWDRDIVAEMSRFREVNVL